MAYPTGLLSLTLEGVDRTAAGLKAFCERTITTAAAGNIPASTIFDVYIRLSDAKSAFNAAAAVPGIAQFAKDQKGDQTLDVVAEFTAMVAAIDSATAWITTNFPTSSGYLLAQTWGANGPVDRQFTPATTATFRTALQAIVDAIE